MNEEKRIIMNEDKNVKSHIVLQNLEKKISRKKTNHPKI